MKSLFPSSRILTIGLLTQLLVGPAALAGTTDIANQPLANITGTATVKPNIVFILDDSGSMGWDFNPDWVNDSHCVTSAGGRTNCVVGNPPYMSPDFNKQYYNPAITYLPPVKHDGTTYNSMTAANTSNWASVKTDGFGIQNTNQLGSGTTTANLITGYPDEKWCTAGGATCATNSGGYFSPTRPMPSAPPPRARPTTTRSMPANTAPMPR
jgi:type IV pilus assembly protein PilY1